MTLTFEAARQGDTGARKKIKKKGGGVVEGLEREK